MIYYEMVNKIDDISKEDFLKEYKATNTPLVIKNLSKDWNAKKVWSLEYFESIGEDIAVDLYDSEPATDSKLQHAAHSKTTLKSYVELLRKGEKDLRMFFFDIVKNAPILTKDFSFPDMGLNLFKRLPVLFIGGKGAKVQMHFDIDYADILLCHFGGKKSVMLFPPEETPYMYHVPYSFSTLYAVDFQAPDYEKYPALKNLKGMKVELDHGDTLYIPPGWWHYISYDEISYSIAIRAFPREFKNFVKMIRNVFWIRTVEGMMRKLLGQKWNNRNEKLAIINTDKNMAKNA